MAIKKVDEHPPTMVNTVVEATETIKVETAKFEPSEEKSRAVDEFDQFIQEQKAFC